MCSKGLRRRYVAFTARNGYHIRPKCLSGHTRLYILKLGFHCDAYVYVHVCAPIWSYGWPCSKPLCYDMYTTLNLTYITMLLDPVQQFPCTQYIGIYHFDDHIYEHWAYNKVQPLLTGGADLYNIFISICR